MKKILLTFLILLSFLSSKSQACINVTNAILTNPSGDNITWRLTIDWSSSGTKHLNTVVLVGRDTVLNTCHQSQGNGRTGTLVYDNIISPLGSSEIKVFMVRNTGTCGNGISCGTTVTIINNVLPLKITNITAKNIDNFTHISFKVESLDKVNRMRVNYVLSDNSKKYYDIKLPENIRVGDIITISINNINGTYIIK
jgi:hypothetical protein